MPSKIQASHILVKSEDKAKELSHKLEAGASFAELAKNESLCSSRKKGGNLGWFGHGHMVKEFERVAFSTKKGCVSQPVKTQFGWHLILVHDTKG